MKRKLIPFLIAVVLIIAIASGAIVAKKYMPTKELADLSKVFGVTGEETLIYFNDEKLEETQALTKDGQTYLP